MQRPLTFNVSIADTADDTAALSAPFAFSSVIRAVAAVNRMVSASVERAASSGGIAPAAASLLFFFIFWCCGAVDTDSELDGRTMLRVLSWPVDAADNCVGGAVGPKSTVQPTAGPAAPSIAFETNFVEPHKKPRTPRTSTVEFYVKIILKLKISIQNRAESRKDREKINQTTSSFFESQLAFQQ